MKRLNPLLIACFLLVTLSASAQKLITVEDFTTQSTFSEKTVTGINWMNDGQYYTSLSNNQVIQYSTTTGHPVRTLLDGNALSPRLALNSYSFSADESKLLLMTDRESIYRRSYKANYYLYDLAEKKLTRLSASGKLSYASFSPNGNLVAYVHDNNLYYINPADMNEVQVTTDGKFNSVINGSTDWVYEEELSFAKAFFWSPDGQKLAYYRFDESDVKEYTLQLWNPEQVYPQAHSYKYPKAGEDNSIVEIWVYDLGSGNKVKMDIGQEKDIYIPRVQWTKDPSLLSMIRMDRLQQTLEILHADVSTGSSKMVLQEKSATYIDIDYCGEINYLADGKSFTYSSEQSGFKHLYLYAMDGTLVRPLTGGTWEVTEFVGLDEKEKMLYYLSTESNHLEQQFYSITMDGKRKTKLSAEAGWHTLNMSNDFQYYIDYHSSATQPETVRLYQTRRNRLVKVLEENTALKTTLSDYNIQAKEFFNFTAVDDTELDGYMIKPVDFNPSREYPVLVYQYSGPRSLNVSNDWSGSHYYFHQMMVQKGYIVAVIDPRGSGSRGEAFAKSTYKQLGKLELEDQLAGANYLGTLSYIDDERIGIWGWSYGAYVAALAMTKGAGTYDVGIAVAPVTNWRLYDNIYTERFLQRPQDNPKGYDENSPTTYAALLEGDFLMVHGTGDDNVHFQNSLLLEDALVNAGKQFRSFYYPNKNHGLAPGIESRQHLYKMMAAFLEENL